VVLTAASEVQSRVYKEHIESRIDAGVLPKHVCYIIIADPDDKRVGSGGATLNVLRYLKKEAGCDSFSNKHILCIHSGGDSKRVPQYSASGKLFSSVPRLLPDGRRSTLFDEIIIWTIAVPPRITDGMFVCSGDTLLLFNPLLIDFYNNGAAAISFKETPEAGENHGVYVCDNEGYVSSFLHKQSISVLCDSGAIDRRGKIDIDTGAVVLSSTMLEELYTLTDSEESFLKYANDNVRLSFYGDFLFPLAGDSTLEQYLEEKTEGNFSEELIECRKALWDILSKYRLKLIRLAPASFIHFGTTNELLELMVSGVDDFRWLDWSKHVLTNSSDKHYAASNSYIDATAEIGDGCYIEDSMIGAGVVIGQGCVISCCDLFNVCVPDGTVLHALKQKDGRCCIRSYGVFDNPKERIWFGKSLDEPLWSAALHPVRDTMRESVEAALRGDSRGACMSLEDSFAHAESSAIRIWQTQLSDKIQALKIYSCIKKRIPACEALPELKQNVVSKGVVERLEELAHAAEFGEKIRIYYYLSLLLDDEEKERMLEKCFRILRDTVLNAALSDIAYDESLRIGKDKVIVNLPLRVNFGGGWSDTPPYCLEHGGTVLNAAITINDEFPVEVVFERTKDEVIILSSVDDGAVQTFSELADIQDCHDPFDTFALHKAVLISCGVIPHKELYKEFICLRNILQRLGGGFKLSTQVRSIPRGSGLGTSSIIAGACVKAAFEFFGKDIKEALMYSRVLCMEQLMSTGGGWQDQVGGLVPGIKIVRSNPALKQQIIVEQLDISEETYKELDERFCLIYTGQRRLARNLLREIVGSYLVSKPDTMNVLGEIQSVATQMKDTLIKGDIDAFASKLNEHWELSKRLDTGSTNTCIDQLLESIEDLIAGKMICGAGGGGFLQTVLKKGVTNKNLRERLGEIFGDCGVDVWECRVVR